MDNAEFGYSSEEEVESGREEELEEEVEPEAKKRKEYQLYNHIACSKDYEKNMKR
jgi:hypothetical protein